MSNYSQVEVFHRSFLQLFVHSVALVVRILAAYSKRKWLDSQPTKTNRHCCFLSLSTIILGRRWN